MIYNILFLINIFTNAYQLNCDDINIVRAEYNSIESETSLESFYSKIQKADCEKFTPYKASVIMQRAQYVFSPIKKLNYFTEGKRILENIFTNTHNQ